MLGLQSRAGRQHPPSRAGDTRLLQALASLPRQGGAASWRGSTTQPSRRRGQRPRSEGKQRICTHVGTHMCSLGPATGVPRTPARHRPSPDTNLSSLQGRISPQECPHGGVWVLIPGTERFLCHRLSSACSLSPCEHQLT